MKLETVLAATLATALVAGALPAQADPIDRPAREWSQPSYDRQDYSPPDAAPKLDDFTGIVNDEDALFDGDGRLIDRRNRANR